MPRRREHDYASGHAAGPRAASQRQLLVGEELRHALARLLLPGGVRDPASRDANVTVTHVRVIPDLNNATSFVVPLSGTKVGHAGTLDPLATGVLPLALGEATKTARFAAAGKKRYRFRVRWGVATDTDDREGRVIGETAARPDATALAAALPSFTGTI